MGVIVRLQNLPWSAKATDIRAFFEGLSLPDGRVYIVGGERGDAFILFSTDEDGRQAMLMDGVKLKEVRIKLFLSSEAEMRKVVEQAIHGDSATSVATSTTANYDYDYEDLNSTYEEMFRDSRCRDNSRDRPRGSRQGRFISDKHQRISRYQRRKISVRDKELKVKDRSSGIKRKSSNETDVGEIKRPLIIKEEPIWEITQNTTKVPFLQTPSTVPTVLQMHNGIARMQYDVTPVINFPYNLQDEELGGSEMKHDPTKRPFPPQEFLQRGGRGGLAPSTLGAMEMPLRMGNPRTRTDKKECPPVFGIRSRGISKRGKRFCSKRGRSPTRFNSRTISLRLMA